MTPTDPTLDALRALPREAADERFTEDLMRRIVAERPAPASAPLLRPRWALAAAALVALVAVPIGWQAVERQQAESLRQERLATLRDEYRRLQAELERVNRLARTAEPVLLLGGDDRHDYVLDLRTVAEFASAPRNANPVTEPPVPGGRQESNLPRSRR